MSEIIGDAADLPEPDRDDGAEAEAPEFEPRDPSSYTRPLTHDRFVE